MKVLKHGVELELPDEIAKGNLKMFPEAFKLPSDAPKAVEEVEEKVEDKADEEVKVAGKKSPKK